jgi:pimeloyl-ACP methyl ester carboxylesterase
MRPLVIAIHGAAVNAATWLPVTRALADDADVEAPDLAGHGMRRNESFGLGESVAELARMVTAASPHRRVFLAGDSLGGYLALATAAALPEAVSGVIAGSCTYPMRGPAAALARFSLLADVVSSEWPLVAIAKRFAPPDIAEAIVTRGFAPRMRGRTLRALLGHDVSGDITAIRVPVIFVVGAFDIPIIWYASRMAHAGIHTRVRVVSRAGHGVAFTHPDAFADAIRACIAEAGSS